MSESNGDGVIRVGRKGLKKFAFGDEGVPFQVDVVVAFQEWIGIDDGFRPTETNSDGNRLIPADQMPEYHEAAVNFVERLANAKWVDGGDTPPLITLTVAEALDFIARLREQYDELAVFFRPKLREEPDSQDTSEAELRFSVEDS